MTEYIVSGQQMTDIANSIRGKLGEQDTYKISDMPTKISNIQGVPMCTLTITNNSEYQASINLMELSYCIVFDGKINSIEPFMLYSEIPEFIEPNESKTFKIFYQPLHFQDNIKSGERPASYLGITKNSVTESYSGIFTNLNNISIYVYENSLPKSNNYLLIPYPTNTSLDSSFTMYISGGK